MSRPTGQNLQTLLAREDIASMVIDLLNKEKQRARDSNQAGLALSWSVTTPAVPASTVNETNTNPKPVTVYVRGGTVTNITVDGVALGFTSGTFRVNSGGTIAITYSVAPTWFWYGD